MISAIYAGSFDPFTNGHLSVLKQASQIFDKVYLVFAENVDKERRYPVGKMTLAVEQTIEDKHIENVEILYLDKLISDFAKQKEVLYLVRGLRNPNDFVYEENIAKINTELNPELHTIYIRADNEIISSTMVNELFLYGKDVSNYVSTHVLKLMMKQSGFLHQLTTLS